MSFETGKATARRLHDQRFATRYFRGLGIDIGSGTDPLSNYAPLFPGILGVRNYDKDDGDAQTMHEIPDNTYGFVHSSHCLEHIRDHNMALKNWIRILQPGGHLIIVVPDEDLYEQGVWPSDFNEDHKHTFTLSKPYNMKFPDSVNLLDLIGAYDDLIQPLKIELLDAGYLHGFARFDQSPIVSCEPAIEIIARKL